MRHLIVSLLALVAMISPAIAFDTPTALLEALYSPYSKGADFDWSGWDETQFRSAHLNQLFAKDLEEADGEVGRIDFDPYIDGQDYQITALKIGEPAIDRDTATVEVTFNNFDTPDDLTFTLVKEADGWKIDDVVSVDKNFPYSLKAIMEGPLQ